MSEERRANGDTPQIQQSSTAAIVASESQTTHRALEEVTSMAAILVGGHTGPSQVIGVRIAVVLIPSYEFLDAQLHAGNDLLIRNRKTGKTQMVQFL
jgi:hypothetical protein